jgi:aminoglycoside phosphotransferase (APT) family kinase protein
MDDMQRLARWMATSGLGDDAIAQVRTLSGGTQNELIRFVYDGRPLVLRRAAAGAGEDVGRTIVREARILGSLGATRVPHAPLVATCEDPAVLGRPFFLMEAVEGFCPAEGLPERVASDTAAQRAMGLAMFDGLSALATVEAESVFPDARARGERWLARQPEQWEQQLAGYGLADDADGLGAHGAREAAAWLRERRPNTVTHGLVHGDYHFGNVLFASDGAALAAIVDWELATVADPLLDLGHLLATWPGVDANAITDRPSAPGLPSTDELIGFYVQRHDPDPERLRWFRVLAAYRLAVLLEGTRARAARGQAAEETGAALHAMALKLLAQADCIIYG